MQTATQTTGELRVLVRGTYDLQKLRIQMGNRIVGNFKVKLGQEPSESEDVLEEDAKELLKMIRTSYDLITDGVIENLPTRKKFKAQGVISTYTELVLVSAYISIERDEKRHFARFESVLEDYPIWNAWLRGVIGIGPSMGGVIIRELDPHSAKYPSSFWAYAGLDVAEDGQGRSRRKEHLVEREYVNKKGEKDTRMSITFNPWLKTKLMGVLAASFIKTSRFHTIQQLDAMQSMTKAQRKKVKPEGEYKSPYTKIYYEYKHRLESNPAHDEKTKGHRNNMALRYMIKIFLIDLHREWRALEGLPPSVTYAEAKLEMSHTEHETHNEIASQIIK